MKTMLAAVMVSVAVLSGVAMAQAADITQADIQKKVSKSEYPKPVGRVDLADNQMKQIRLGTLRGLVTQTLM
jgi:hypothetical protein